MNEIQQNTSILIYTREPENEYTESLSNSVHLAFFNEKGELCPLNRNYGILFALASVDQNNVIHEKGLKKPYLFRTADGTFGILAVRVDKEGMDDIESKGHVLLWTSEDLINFQCHGLVKLHDDLYVNEAICTFNRNDLRYEIIWQDNESNTYRNTFIDFPSIKNISLPVTVNKYQKEQITVNFSNIFPGNIINVEREIYDAMKSYWLPIYNTEIRLPERVSINSQQQLQLVKATAVYSDGSSVEKQVRWDFEGIDFSMPGVYTVKGKVEQESFPFPLAKGYADPVILPWNNKYYYLATNDNVDDIGIYVREGATNKDLFKPGFKESIILDVDEEKGFIQTFWAPEFHVIGDELYILFAVSGKIWGPQCHMMKLKKGGDIMNAKDWESPVRVKKADQTFLAEDGITLDMNYFKADGVSCLVWSYRKNIGSPLDTGSMLYIATTDEKNPTVLTSEPVLLSRPLYGWENIQGTINNEGPYSLVTDDMVYITYSGGAANGYTYALGLLSIRRNSNYLDASAWKKSGTPVLSYYSIEGIYGPGHNSFFKDYNGNIMIMYHGETKIAAKDTRCSGMHRVHFNKKGNPAFDVAKERDLNPALAEVILKVCIECENN